MAANVMVDTALSYVINIIFNKLSSSDLVNFARSERVFNDFDKLRKTLFKLQAVLQDAEEKQITNGAVKIWLRDLRDLVFDAEDVIDEFSFEVLRRKVMAKADRRGSSSKVSSLVTKCCLSLNLGYVPFNVKMGSKMKEINGRLRELVEQRDDLDLRETSSTRVVGERSYKKTWQRLPSTSLVDESRVYGRENDKEAIVKLLLNGDVGGDGVDKVVSVVPIVGMGGVGKTTLAQLVYNDDRVVQCFDFRAWVCVSEDFDAARITRTVLQSVSSESFEGNDLNSLQVQLKKRLMERKFLIVLDDVWNENYDVWTVARKPFEAGMVGSKIVVTTRNKGVASVMGTVLAYCLNELANEDCLCLFAEHALGRRDFYYHPNLKAIGEEIVRRCKGLPLAAKTLGGLLRTKQHYEEWESVLNSKIWDLPEQKSGLLPALKLSYYYLPSCLKQCFAYCAIFPKDYELDKEELVLLWMAEGFLSQPRGQKKMEDLGCQYFDELLSRSFFQRSKSNKESRFVIHDLIHDLALSIAGDMCFILNDSELYISREKSRHMSFTRHTYEISLRFKELYRMKFLRTFIALPIQTSSWAAFCYLSSQVLLDLLPQLRRLRVLSLSGYCISELPHSIGGLKHLRYINLSYTKIERLPESLGSLYNLQSLILEGCSELTELPQSIGNLVNLHCLDITDTHSLKRMPPGLGNLKSLQILPKFFVRKENGFGLGELRDLYLRGKLSIYSLQNVSDLRDAWDANLKEKHELDELELHWDQNFNDSVNGEDEMCVLESLQPHKNLKKITVSFYSGTKFPSWIGDPCFTKIVRFNIYNCKSMSLPSLGRLPSLREVFIDGMDKVEKIGYEFLGVDFDSCKLFPSLEILWFQNMLTWKDWDCSFRADEEEFPCLRELVIRNCPNLIGKLPSRLPSLEKLIISQCPELQEPLVSLPSLHELHIEKCSGLTLRSIVDLPSQTMLKIRSMTKFIWFPRLMTPLKLLVVSGCHELKFLWQKGAGLQNFISPEHLIIDDCLQLESLADKEEHFSHHVKDLTLLDCDYMVKPWGLHGLMGLKYLQIESCPKLVSLSEIDFLSTIRLLVIRNCPSLVLLPCGLMVLDCKSNNSLLEDLEIEGCPSLTSFPTGQLPHTLKSFKIRYCKNLEYLPEGIVCGEDSSTVSYLETLEIVGCSSLSSFPAGKLPIGLKVLKIWDCPELEPLSEKVLHPAMSVEYISIWNCRKLTYLPECPQIFIHLIELSLNNCPLLKSFPETGLYLPSLKTMNIYDCASLKSLPVQMKDLTSLQDLIICKCPALVYSPNGGLPPNLTSLEIWDCEKFSKPMSAWDLRFLTSLRDFSIAGGCFRDTISFPDQNCLLPSNLVSIWIGRLSNLESLSVGLRNLKSLEDLEIVHCPKLQSLPKEGLPATLGRLSIKDCPLLIRKSSTQKGEYWPMITYIPCIEIDDENAMN